MVRSAHACLLAVLAWSAVFACTGCEGGADPDDRRGEPCTADSACGALVCALDAEERPEDLAPAELVCGDATDGEAPGAECESGDDCDHGLCLLAGGCAVACETQADCNDDERCAEVFTRVAEDALQSLTACVRRVDLSGDPEVRVRTLGDPLRVGDNLFALEPAEDSDARTFLVLEHSETSWPGERCAPPLCLLTLSTDGGERLFDTDADYGVDPPPLLPIATGGHIDPLVLRLPTGDEPGASPRYFADLQTEHAGELTVTTISRERTGQALDLHVFYVGELSLSPSGERGPRLFAEALDRVDEILGQAGVFIGRVHQVAVRGELPMRGTYFPMGL
jgi:hypothetical protein